MSSYAPNQARDKGEQPIVMVPAPIPSKQLTATAPTAVSSVISFGANTTMIEVTALNASLAFKWGSASVIAAAGATANFDHIVPVNQTRRFVIPINSQGVPSIVGANAQYGLYSTMAVIATASVLSAINEY